MTVPQGRVAVSYVPGRWVALVADNLWLLADLDAGGAILAACWEAVERRAGVDGLLGVILREGLRSVPSFALAGRTPTGYRVLVSGKASAETRPAGPDGPVVVSAAGAPTWIEQHVNGTPDLRLAGDGADGATDTVLPIVGGIVAASVVLIGAAAAAPPQAVPAPDAPPEAVPVPAAPTQAPPTQAPPTAVMPVTSAAPPYAAPSAEVPPLYVPPPAYAPPPFVAPPATPVAGPPSTDTLTPRPEDDRGLIESLPWRSPESYAPPDGEPPLREPGPADAPAEPRFEAPRFPSPPDFDDPPPFAPPAFAEPPVFAEQPAFGTPAPPTDQFWMPPQTPAPAPPSVAGDRPVSEAVQYTVERPAAPGGPTGTAAPLVHAVSCPLRHLNPPYAGSCRVCGQPVAAQDPFTAPRPNLGLLVLSTGDTVPLDRDVVLGRAPFHVDSNARSRPHLVQLASPGNDISRSHVRISLEGWHVQVVDLGSTNGTVVTLPGQPAVRLRAHDPFTVVAGTTISIADEVEVRFEVPA